VNLVKHMKVRTSKWSHLFYINKIIPIFGNIPAAVDVDFSEYYL